MNAIPMDLGPSSSANMAALQRLEKAVQEQKVERDLADRGYVNMNKAVTTNNIANVVPQDLEREAYNALWDPRNTNVLMAIKLIPSIDAYQILHLFSRITSYGQTAGMGFIGETSIPQASDPGFEQREVRIRLLAALAEVYKLAALERTIKVGGNVGAAAIAKWTVMRDFLWRTNRAFYYADTTTQRLGDSSTVFKGLLQQIREGTDGTVDTSTFGSHVIDMEGLPLTPDTLRKRLLQVIQFFGAPTCMITSPDVRADFEANLDSAGRIAYPINGQSFVQGQRVGGFRTNEVNLAFHTDLQCGPYHGQGKYRAVAAKGAPAIPAATLTYNASPTGSNESKFDSNFAGASSCFWILTEVRDGIEGLGRRLPSSGVQVVAAGAEAAFSLQASDVLSDSFRIYRGGLDEDGNVVANTEAYFVKEVANSSDGSAVTAYDLNHTRPNTHIALVLDIASPAHDYFDRLQQGQISDKASPAEMAETFGTQEEIAGNTIARARLGPEYGTMELAAYALHEARPVLFTAQALEVRAPPKNLVFINVRPRISA
jgi:hypothetical protein